MQILPVNRNQNSTAFNAALRVTPAAKSVVYTSGAQNTHVANMIFDRTMNKFQNMLYGKFPFAGNVFFDAISKKTKAAKPHTNSQYEMRISDASVDFDFNHNSILYNHSNQPIEEKIEHFHLITVYSTIIQLLL